MLAFPFFIVLVAFALIASIFPAILPRVSVFATRTITVFAKILAIFDCVIREFTMPAVQVVLWLWLYAGFGNAHRE